MNNVKEVQRINQLELTSGLTGTSGSWHEEYRRSCWVFVGNLATNLSEGDVLAVMSQYGEIDDIHLLRVEEKKEEDKDAPKDDRWGKKGPVAKDKALDLSAPVGSSRGSCFVKYSVFESCILSVDNLNGATLLGRTLRVDHVKDYRGPKREEGQEVPDASAPGLAYAGKKLANDHDIQKGVDLFAGKPKEEEEVVDLKGYELVDEEGDDDHLGGAAGFLLKEKERKEKSSKKEKKAKKDKKEKKEKKSKKEKKKKEKKEKKDKKEDRYSDSDSSSSSDNDSEGSTARKRRRQDSF